ncbi:MAG: hypothetical protein F2659_02220 [Actinobacteria bacterium]|jgi:hypothetical protein|uniref:Unannotated protein n=1 Tax=freshwater metagenome TaxID=449393 RepID=A0A6J6NK76_9ZZZZ|nr:hypothetical protein [Actinomycetota bacterium]
MSFGQTSGPPASAKQIALLLSLLNNDGFDFATARHRYGLNQRQARGKFTGPEASELIDRLTREAEDAEAGSEGVAPRFDDPAAIKAQQRIDTQRDALLRGIPAEVLANELERRGWAIIPPS